MSSYTQRIDLTSKGIATQRAASRPSLREPQPALPEASLSALPESMQAAAKKMGWPSLMPVQARAIPYILNKQDLVVQSKTGSGKTGAFLLPLFEMLDRKAKGVQALILTPTRELARQIDTEFNRMKEGSEETSGFTTALVFGGVAYGPQINALKGGAEMVIGTPGRILDLLEKRSFSLDQLRVLVLDEADEMLSMGFYPAMRALKRYLPRERTSYMFSATIPYRVQQLGEDFLTNQGFLSLSADKVHVDVMEHRYYVVEQMNKDRSLARLLEMENPESAIIFSNTKREVEYLTQFLRNYGYNADEISGDLTQSARDQVMARIRAGTLRFLVATDVAARGIDISDLSHVFMYDVPQDTEYYIHRAGRTARAGKTGVAITLATTMDQKNLLSIARHYEIDIQKRELPTKEELQERVGERLTVILEERLRRKSNIERERMERFVPLVSQLVEDGEPEVLAMLLDELYQAALSKTPPEAAAEGGVTEPPRKAPRRETRKGEGRRR